MFVNTAPNANEKIGNRYPITLHLPHSMSAITASLAVNMAAQLALRPASNPWASLTAWDYAQFTDSAAPGGLSAYPFIERVELFTATGGCYQGA
jgi:hypothetical protein